MATKRDIHLIPYGKNWAVKREGAERISSQHENKTAADKVGRDMARRDGVEFTIHGKDGRIQDSDSFGQDPRSVRDTVH